MQNTNFISDHYTKPILVLGCGNVLFGDDGFGPEVIEYFKKNYTLAENVELINAGSGARNILFDILLSEKKPKRIIIVDAVDVGKQAGEIFELNIENVPENKIDDFSLHQLPTSNLLRELKEFAKVDITIVACQVKDVPEEVAPGLSETVRDSLPKACQMILKILREIEYA